MGNKQMKYITFDGIKKVLCDKQLTKNTLFINTLPNDEQDCLILNTVHASVEVSTIERCEEKNQPIIIYGKNCLEFSPDKKYDQLKELGFTRVFIYRGGLFEWLLLQQVYGEQEFPTTSRERDILKFSYQG